MSHSTFSTFNLIIFCLFFPLNVMSFRLIVPDDVFFHMKTLLTCLTITKRLPPTVPHLQENTLIIPPAEQTFSNCPLTEQNLPICCSTIEQILPVCSAPEQTMCPSVCLLKGLSLPVNLLSRDSLHLF
jgi:hypothetical protein